ncbi:MAG: BON domain-containing protein [Gammaproteobacteria bacterium AqS3]|nr:BON domain-containing protein [Gammaproteobacteria bacterium AqS3]
MPFSQGGILIISLLMLCTLGSAREISSHERSRGTKLNDRDIVRIVERSFKRDKNSDDFKRSNVFSFNQIVLLTGQVASEAASKNAARFAAKIPLVRKVHNFLEISGATTSISRISDRLVRSRARRAVRKLDIRGETEVIVTNGRIYLLGLLTREEAAEVNKTVRAVKGATHVVALYEYL